MIASQGDLALLRYVISSVHDMYSNWYKNTLEIN